MKKKIISLILAILTAIAAPIAIVGAYYNLPLDAGNFHRYSGGSHRSSGSHRSYSGRSGSGSGTMTGSDASDAIIILIIVAIIIFIIVVSAKISSKKSRGFTPKIMPTNYNVLITSEINKTDKSFSCEKFLEFASYIYNEIQIAWMNRDWQKIRTLEKEELFEHHNTQLQEYIRLGRINMMEQIHVRESYLHKYVRDNEFEYLTVYLDVTMHDYIIDEHTRKVIMGNKNENCNMKYLMTFIRHKGVSADIIDGVVTPLCPHCGAPVTAGSAGVCQYCNSVIHSEDYNWVLSDMEAIDENTQIDNSGIINR